MNARIFLSRAWNFELQVQSKLEQIEALKSLACRVNNGFGTEKVSASRNPSSMEDVILRIMELEGDLNRRIDELVAIKREIARTIDMVEDVNLRKKKEKRYLSFLPWEQIAVDLHYTGRWLRDKHVEALRAVQRILDEREENGG